MTELDWWYFYVT